MKKILTLALALAVVATALADDKADIQARYNSMMGAIKAKKAEGYLAVCSKNAVWKNAKGTKVQRAQVEGILKAQLSSPVTFSTAAVTITSIKKQGADYLVRATSKMTGSVPAPDMKDKNGKVVKAHQMKIDSTSVSDDVWTKEGGKWMLKSVTAVSSKTLLDGKEMKAGR